MRGECIPVFLANKRHLLYCVLVKGSIGVMKH